MAGLYSNQPKSQRPKKTLNVRLFCPRSGPTSISISHAYSPLMLVAPSLLLLALPAPSLQIPPPPRQMILLAPPYPEPLLPIQLSLSTLCGGRRDILGHGLGLHGSSGLRFHSMSSQDEALRILGRELFPLPSKVYRPMSSLSTTFLTRSFSYSTSKTQTRGIATSDTKPSGALAWRYHPMRCPIIMELSKFPKKGSFGSRSIVRGGWHLSMRELQMVLQFCL